MITMSSLRDALRFILWGARPSFEPEQWDEDVKQLIPLQGNFWMPTVDPENKKATWVGFTILDTRSRVRTVQQRNTATRDVQVRFRVTFIGPQAEDWANRTLLWDDRSDVRTAFEEMNAQLNYIDRSIYVEHYSQDGQNSTLVWVVDFSAMCFYSEDTHQKPWVPIGGGVIIP